MTVKRALDTAAAWAAGGPLPALGRALDLLDLLDRVAPRVEGMGTNERMQSKQVEGVTGTLAKLRSAAEADLAATLGEMDALCGVVDADVG
jgi:hypothetical protein